jgi:hypothetical protein
VPLFNQVFNGIAYRDKKVVGVFVHVFRAPLHGCF